MDKYEKLYNEALERARKERIRKEMISFLRSPFIKENLTDEKVAPWLDWLEKQKENPKSADSISADCASLAKCEDRNSKYGVFPEDVIVVARACEKLEVHGYTELAHALKNVNLYTKKPVDYDHEMWKNCEANFEGGKKEVIDHPEKYGLQKEQKPELVQHPPITFTFNSNASRDERLKAALLALLNSDLLKVKEGGYFTKQDLIDWVERIPTDKPAWSEEDEKMIQSLIREIDKYVFFAGIDAPIIVSWLKSLRPSWKPSDQDD